MDCLGLIDTDEWMVFGQTFHAHKSLWYVWSLASLVYKNNFSSSLSSLYGDVRPGETEEIRRKFDEYLREIVTELS